MQAVVLAELERTQDHVEVVERKGLGHPDTICDALADNFSRNLCREYRARFGRILHHNVDKALLCGGRTDPAFGGGTVRVPIRIYLAGRAVATVGDETVSLRDIAIEGSRAWLRTHLHALDAERHVVIENVVEQGSHDLRDLFARNDQVPLANDTSFGVGYAPLSPLEALVLALERRINERGRDAAHPAWGEDIKVMGIRRGSKVDVTVACAMIGRYLDDIDAYRSETSALERVVREVALESGFASCEVCVNAADNLSAGSIYLTVTGTSAEAGDDGQVGRGNRVNGLITPARPMSLEAAAGKNPVSHVGKIYNALARHIAQTLIATVPEIEAAQCLMVSRIGAPVSEPAAVQVKLATRDKVPVASLQSRVDAVVADGLDSIPKLSDQLIAGVLPLF